MKRLWVLLALLTAFITGCASKENAFDERTLYQSNNIIVKTVDKAEKKEYQEVSWQDSGNYDVEFEGVIKNSTEVLVSGSKNENTVFLYKTILEVEITDINKGEDEKYAVGKTVKVLAGISSRYEYENCPDIEEGKNYSIKALDAIKTPEEILEIEGYSDCYITNPVLNLKRIE